MTKTCSQAKIYLLNGRWLYKGKSIIECTKEELDEVDVFFFNKKKQSKVKLKTI